MNLKQMMGGKTRKVKDSAKQDLIDLVEWYDEMSDQRPLTANEIKRVKELKEDLDEYKYTGWGVGTYMDLCDKIISKQQVSDSRRVKDSLYDTVTSTLPKYVREQDWLTTEQLTKYFMDAIQDGCRKPNGDYNDNAYRNILVTVYNWIEMDSRK